MKNRVSWFAFFSASSFIACATVGAQDGKTVGKDVKPVSDERISADLAVGAVLKANQKAIIERERECGAFLVDPQCPAGVEYGTGVKGHTPNAPVLDATTFQLLVKKHGTQLRTAASVRVQRPLVRNDTVVVIVVVSEPEDSKHEYEEYTWEVSLMRNPQLQVVGKRGLLASHNQRSSH